MMLDANQFGEVPLEHTDATQMITPYALKTVALRPHLIWAPAIPILCLGCWNVAV